MNTITRKSDLIPHLDQCFQTFGKNNLDAFFKALHKHILHHKVKFLLLELVAEQIFEQLPEETHIPLCEHISKGQTEGGNVIIGKLLQLRLPTNYVESVEKAAAYINSGSEWYVADIIGERVFGVALLSVPEKALTTLSKLRNHRNPLVIRSIGAGAHYAIKKGLSSTYAEKVFQLLLSMATSKDGEMKTGIGWAAKTTAKFHPSIIQKYRTEIDDPNQTGQWFRTKVQIGLERNAHDQRN